MRTYGKLTLIGIIGAAVLAVFLQAIHSLTGSNAYILLYNIDYIPLLKAWDQRPVVGVIFHIIFCIASVILLYAMLKMVHLQRSLTAYVLIYTMGSAMLYPLTGLSNHPPELGDLTSWLYWTLGHFIYSIIVGLLVIRQKERGAQQDAQSSQRIIRMQR
ncbi:hypothetical protein GCM10008983_11680 [Lentibacillus halophilus]|uniref:Uncharacterized protein n=1 Tax=Lentibacillus halophilus TaxID=295065 RepID=A0ABN0Z8A3_9BACI